MKYPWFKSLHNTKLFSKNIIQSVTNKKMTMSQILKNYNDVLNMIKTLNQTKSDFNNQILKALGYDENKPKKLYTKEIGKHIVMCKVSQSYSLDLSEVKKEFPILDTDEKAKSKFYKLNSPRKEIVVEVNND